VRHEDLDWSLGNAVRKERLRLLIFSMVLVAGIVLASTGWTWAGTLLILTSILGAVSRFLVGMLKTPGTD
jgi:hypothetical protein